MCIRDSASRADEDGNVEILGPRALDTIMAGASKQVIVTVDEVVPREVLAREKKREFDLKKLY